MDDDLGVASAPPRMNSRRGSILERSVERRGSQASEGTFPDDAAMVASSRSRRGSVQPTGRRKTIDGMPGLRGFDDDEMGDKDVLSMSPDEAFKQSLQHTTGTLEELIAAACSTALTNQEGAAALLEVDDRAELEASVREVFNNLLRRARELAQEHSDADAKATRAHSKAAARLFQDKLERARTAANVSLKNKSVEMSATFHKKLLEKVHELSEGGSSLLIEAQEREEMVMKQLAEERLNHDSTKDALKLAQTALEDAEAKAAASDEERERLESGRDELRRALEIAHAEIMHQIAAARADANGAVSVTAALQSAFSPVLTPQGRSRDSSPAGRMGVRVGGTTSLRQPGSYGSYTGSGGEQSSPQAGSVSPPFFAHQQSFFTSPQAKPLVDRFGELMNASSALHRALHAKLADVNVQRDTAQASLLEATGEAERAAMMHAVECKRLTEQLALRMRKEQSSRGDQQAPEQLRRCAPEAIH